MKPTIAKSLFGVILLSIISLGDNSVFGQGIQVENTLPKSVPLKVEFKGFDKEKWWYDLEIKVTNTGKKPIYYLNMWLMLDVTEGGKPLGVSVQQFGDGERFYAPPDRALTKESDPAIIPGESYTLRLEEYQVKAWDLGYRTKVNFYAPTKGELRLAWLSFGDDTGIEGGGTTLRKKAILDRKP